MTTGHDADRCFNPRVSIILPVYRRVSLLPAALASLGRQSFADYELLISDDGSDPPLARWIEWLAPHAKYIRLEKNAGPAVARGLAANHAKADYLAFLDSDDIWAVETLARHVDALDHDPDAVLTFVDCLRTGLHYATRKPLPETHDQQRKRVAVTNFIYTMSQVAMRKETFFKIGGFDERLPPCEDQGLYAKCLDVGTIRNVPYPGVTKRFAGQNISRNLDDRVASADRIARWMSRDYASENRSYATLLVAAVCVSLKTMGQTVSLDWWRHWARITFRHPIACLTHRGWYFALAVKAYQFLCRRSLLFKRAELARAHRRPDLLVLHLTDPSGNTRLLEAFLHRASRRHRDFLPAVIPLTHDAKMLAKYEELGLGIYSLAWFSFGRYPKPPIRLLVVREPNAPADPRADRIVHLAETHNAAVFQLPDETINSHAAIIASLPLAAPTEPAPVILVTLPPDLADRSDIRKAIRHACQENQPDPYLAPVFVPGQPGQKLADDNGMALDAPPELRAYACLVDRSVLVLTDDVDQLLVAVACRRPVIAMQTNDAVGNALGQLDIGCPSVTPDQLSSQLPTLVRDLLQDPSGLAQATGKFENLLAQTNSALDKLIDAIRPDA